MIKQIPNAITSLNLLSGCVAVLFAVSGDLVTAAIFAFIGIFFDFFDGLAARLLKAQSDVGLQLDSLADMVTSGLVPGLVMMKLLERATNTEVIQTASSISETMSWDTTKVSLIPLIGLLITVASAYRLA
ncbi:MAG: CDP-alcohol phosphatidyltransferase family protein, partial [Bacteroidetes bacterium]|nr:CDP-alcohol phosphatidyltransferase family protein [Bacteroidota bacterium]